MTLTLCPASVGTGFLPASLRRPQSPLSSPCTGTEPLSPLEKWGRGSVSAGLLAATVHGGSSGAVAGSDTNSPWRDTVQAAPAPTARRDHGPLQAAAAGGCGRNGEGLLGKALGSLTPTGLQARPQVPQSGVPRCPEGPVLRPGACPPRWAEAGSADTRLPAPAPHTHVPTATAAPRPAARSSVDPLPPDRGPPPPAALTGGATGTSQRRSL